VKEAPPIRDFAVQQVNRLLSNLAFEAHRNIRARDPEAIHDLRVAIRRFDESLRLFPDFFPHWEIKKIRKRLRRMLDLTSEIRNRDIALEYLGEEKVKDASLRTHLQRDRKSHEREFTRMIGRWSARDFSAKWRTSLSLNSQ
jgi:CHAD domain-containing protein